MVLRSVYYVPTCTFLVPVNFWKDWPNAKPLGDDTSPFLIHNLRGWLYEASWSGAGSFFNPAPARFLYNRNLFLLLNFCNSRVEFKNRCPFKQASAKPATGQPASYNQPLRNSFSHYLLLFQSYWAIQYNFFLQVMYSSPALDLIFSLIILYINRLHNKKLILLKLNFFSTQIYKQI